MIKNIEESLEKENIEDLKVFAEYLDIEFEDYLEFLHPEFDFDDYSR